MVRHVSAMSDDLRIYIMDVDELILNGECISDVEETDLDYLVFDLNIHVYGIYSMQGLQHLYDVRFLDRLDMKDIVYFHNNGAIPDYKYSDKVRYRISRDDFFKNARPLVEA